MNRRRFPAAGTCFFFHVFSIWSGGRGGGRKKNVKNASGKMFSSSSHVSNKSGHTGGLIPSQPAALMGCKVKVSLVSDGGNLQLAPARVLSEADGSGGLRGRGLGSPDKIFVLASVWEICSRCLKKKAKLKKKQHFSWWRLRPLATEP